MFAGLAVTSLTALTAIAATPVTAVAAPALGSVSNSSRLPPTYSNWPQTRANWPCYATPSYSCTKGGYSNSTALKSGWPYALYGKGQVSTNSYGMHNCTLYAAYRLKLNGLSANPGSWGNAVDWAKDAAKHYLVNRAPAIGSIAQMERRRGQFRARRLRRVSQPQRQRRGYRHHHNRRQLHARKRLGQPGRWLYSRDPYHRRVCGVAS